MCILIACTVARHRANKCWPFVAKGDPSDMTMLCISCGSVGGSGEPSSVFMGPTIPLEKLSPTILTVQQPVGDWKMLFLSVRNQPDITMDEVDQLAERSSISVPVHMLTECDVLSRYHAAAAAWHAPPIATCISRLQRSCHPLCLSPLPYRRSFSSPSFSTKIYYKTTVT
jgi:hypothetical protein